MEQRERSLMQALVQVIWADGDVAEDEREMLGALLTELGSSEEDIEEVGRLLQMRPQLEDLRSQIPDRASREEVLKLLVAMAMADGRVDTSELRFLNQVAAGLDVSQETLEALKEQTLRAMQDEA